MAVVMVQPLRVDMVESVQIASLMYGKSFAPHESRRKVLGCASKNENFMNDPTQAKRVLNLPPPRPSPC